MSIKNGTVGCCVIGDVNIDIITPPFNPPAKWGESSIVLDSFGMSLGGNAMNVAAELASLGCEHIFFGCLGDGPISRWITERCKKLGVNLRAVYLEGEDAGITFALTFTDGTRQFVATLGTNSLFSSEHIDFDVFNRIGHLHRAGYWYTPKLIGEPTVRIFAEAAKKGVRTSLDVGWDPDGFPEEHIKMLKETLEYCNIFFLNTEELYAITGCRNPEEGARKLLAEDAYVEDRLIVVHMGENGSMIVGSKDSVLNGQAVKVPTRRVNPVNPTGTGDIFNAAFIFAEMRGVDPVKAAEFATDCACVHLAIKSEIYPSLSTVGKYYPRVLDIIR